MDEAARKHLGGVVRERRLARRMTQHQLALQVGVTNQTVSNIEKGETVPTLYKLTRFAEVLEVPLWRFLTPVPLAPAPETLRPDIVAIIQAVDRLNESALKSVRDIVEAFARGRTPP